MLTKIEKVTSDKVVVTSADGDVTVTVDRRGEGHHPEGPLTRQEAHEALEDVEAVTNEFLAAVEADVHATAPN